MKSIVKFIQHSLFLGLAILSCHALAAETPAEKMLATDFINKAAAKGIADIGSAKLALEQSSSQEVKAYAQRMINDNSDINTTLTEVARDKKVAMASSDELVKSAHSFMVNPNEEAFDVAYARNQVLSHQEKIDFFQRAAKSEDYVIRNTASAILPKLRQHLLMAEQLVAATAETKTDIYQDRKNQVNTESNPGVDRVPSTDRD